MGSRSDASQSKLTRAQILKRSGVEDLEQLDFEAFQTHLAERTSYPGFALISDGSVRRILEELAKRFWLRGSILDKGAGENWSKRQKTARDLLKILDDWIRVAESLEFQDVGVWLHFRILGTGRHASGDISMIGHGNKLRLAIKALKDVRPEIAKVMQKRKPRIDHDENLFLYLMAVLLQREHSGISEAAIDREIATLVNAWGDTFVGTAVVSYELHEKDIQVRLARFRNENAKAASQIQSGPFRFVQHFLGEFPQIKNGLRADD